jgi:DNA-binding response OmpR family regulator
VSGVKILVVDDEQSILDLVTAYLRQEGYEVHTAMDGPAGLKAARAFKPDLIVLDVMLPGIDGIELLTRLRRESDVYVIMLTSKSEETDKIVGLSVGADDYLTKPFSPRELVARVKAALRRLRSNTSAEDTSTLAFRRIRLDTGRASGASPQPRATPATGMELRFLRRGAGGGRPHWSHPAEARRWAFHCHCAWGRLSLRRRGGMRW